MVGKNADNGLEDAGGQGSTWKPIGEGAVEGWRRQGKTDERVSHRDDKSALYFELSHKAMQKTSLFSSINFLPNADFGPFHIAAVYPIMRATWKVPIPDRRTK